MAKATSRKHATHHKKARAHHAVKTPARRSSVSKPSESGVSVSEVRIESEVIDDEFSPRSVPRSLDDDADEEVGIYGPGRGEDAG
jgi:hypothetical protein